ncbi:hypothetical protein QU39_00350, partial [Staphylococcus aureus]
ELDVLVAADVDSRAAGDVDAPRCQIRHGREVRARARRAHRDIRPGRIDQRILPHAEVGGPQGADRRAQHLDLRADLQLRGLERRGLVRRTLRNGLAIIVGDHLDPARASGIGTAREQDVARGDRDLAVARDAGRRREQPAILDRAKGAGPEREIAAAGFD